MWARVENNIVLETFVHPKSFVFNGTTYPRSIFRLWSVTDLQALEIYPVINAIKPDKFQDIIGTTYTFDAPNNKVDEFYTVKDKSLENLKTLINASIKVLRDNVMNQGINHIVDSVSHTFDTDSISIANLTGISAAVAGGYILPADFVWRTRANINVSMTTTQLNTFRDAVVNRVNNAYKNSWVHKSNIDALASTNDLDLIQESERYIANDYPVDTTAYPLLVAKATADSDTETNIADALVATIQTRIDALKVLDVTTGWASIPVVV